MPTSTAPTASTGASTSSARAEGVAEAVLVRALEPTRGVEAMATRAASTSRGSSAPARAALPGARRHPRARRPRARRAAIRVPRMREARDRAGRRASGSRRRPTGRGATCWRARRSQSSRARGASASLTRARGAGRRRPARRAHAHRRARRRASARPRGRLRRAVGHDRHEPRCRRGPGERARPTTLGTTPCSGLASTSVTLSARRGGALRGICSSTTPSLWPGAAGL